MAAVTAGDQSSVSKQTLHDAGLNPFAVELLVESYASPRRPSPPPPVTFVYRGVEVSLRVHERS